MTMPNFLLIGAAKSGTSALWKYLPQHPDIFMSKKKEPHFFAYENEIPAACGPSDYTRFAETTLSGYQALFDDVTTESAIGEAAPTSLYYPRAAPRIKKYIPDAKLIVILRHPADRAFSAFMHLIRDQRETESDFSKALLLEEKRIANNWAFIWHYSRAGFYFHQLRQFYNLFDPAQIRIYLFDDFIEAPRSIIQSIYSFLDVDDQFIPDMSVHANMSGTHKNKMAASMLTRLFDRPNPIRYIARRIISPEKRWTTVTNIRNLNLNHQQLPSDLRQELTDFFHDDIVKLQNLINRDLSHWLKT